MIGVLRWEVRAVRMGFAWSVCGGGAVAWLL